jgi:DNA-binding beta-propeller fold protein YncE
VKRNRIRFTLILATLFLIAVPATASAAGSEGALIQKSGADACISETGSSGDCADGVGLDSAVSVTVSPDGKGAYVASASSGAVAVFDRNTTTGALTQKSGADACISETGTGGTCGDGVGLDQARSVTVSPDGKSAYVAAFDSDAVAVFDRNTTTGVLTQKSGTDACISETGTGGACTVGVGLNGANSVTVSPDGKSAYVASFFSDAVAVFDREDSIPPDKPTFDSTTPASPANNNTPSIKGTAETGSTVRLYTTSDCTGTEAATGSAANFAAPGLGVIVTDGSTTTFYATATDGADNTSACSTESIAYTDDSTPPDTTIDKAKIGKVKVKGPSKVKKGKKATYKVKISNSGNAQATGVKLKVKGKGAKAKKKVGKIAAGKTKTVKVKLKFKKSGKVKLTFKVTSSNAGGKSVKKKIKVKK